jgi:hypothetical protein
VRGFDLIVIRFLDGRLGALVAAIGRKIIIRDIFTRKEGNTNLIWRHVKVDFNRTSRSRLISLRLIDSMARKDQLAQLLDTSIQVSHRL